MSNTTIPLGGNGGGTGGGGNSIQAGTVTYNPLSSQVLISTGGSGASWISASNIIPSTTFAPNYPQYAYVRKHDGTCVSLDTDGQQYNYQGRPLVDILLEYKEIMDFARLYSEVQDALDHLKTVVKLRRE